jgi:ATP-binding cassette subfamily B protein RaxB
MYGIRLNLSEAIIFNGQFLLLVFLGATAVMTQDLTIGLLLAFLAYRTSFVSSASALIDQIQQWRLVGVHLDRLSDIVVQTPEPLVITPREELLPGPEVRGQGLTFRYDPGDPPIFENLDFTIPAGSMVAIIGPSGAGKTTFMRMVLGLLTPSEGQLLVDGQRLTPATIAAWRNRIGAVMQDDHLLTGTLSDNITFFDSAPDQDRLHSVCRLALIHDDIMKMPMGYHSLVGDMGAALSSGQRQRILLARALYRDPDVLFLDEGTANLDEETERRVVDTIAALPITRIVIAHRPLLIERADLVLRLEGGKLHKVERRPKAKTPEIWMAGR